MFEFEWNEAKREEVWQTRRVEFETAVQIFLGRIVSVVDDRKDYGEIRYRSVGLVDGDCFVVVHTRREGRIRIITAWKGGTHDRRLYDTHLDGRDPSPQG